MSRTRITSFLIGLLLLASGPLMAAEYKLDTEGQHAFIQFRIQHLGYSWLYGRFNDFDGSFTYDADNPDKSEVEITIDMASIDSNHAERDKHLREEDFFHVKKYPEARFVSTSFEEHDDDTATLKGDLTIKDVTRNVTIDVEHVGHGEDPWGGYRRGFQGTTTIKLKDFNIDYDLGPASTHAEVTLAIEGVRQ
ncbi:YceI family protein [Thiohalophilus thiocyanatoxydans]|uniref:Polyisoprenoid-binding protein YceI n=1 Tax=Thiohalophilus thiocyanatoxydans TaxID=381308 RepID=A0A4R8IIN7_9GAMM|nr:YceI family protein [Thiohalophilus thiocyanatoxydans]TDY00532.1 polyisoprenoid-binding protein YceI [Thiohalophilus thiocyanatoxydans]